MNKWFFLLFLLLVPVVSAVPSISYDYELVNASMFNASTIVNQPSNHELLVRNTGTVPVVNLTCYDIPLFDCGVVPFIEVGGTAFLPFTVLTNEVFDKTIFNLNTHFLFLDPFLVDSVNHSLTVNNVSEQETPFSFRNLSVRVGDLITWFNNDTVSHTVTFINGEIDTLLQNGSSYNYVPQTVGVIEYYDKTTGKNAYVNVLNNTAFFSLHDKDYDESFIVGLSSVYAPTQYRVDLFTTNFLIDYDERLNGVFQIINVMDETAYNVDFKVEGLFDNELFFSPEGKETVPFDLGVNESVIVLFTVDPSINSAEQTGRTYNASLLVNADNSNVSSHDFFVSVNFFDLFQNDTGVCYGSDYWDAKTVYCERFPNSRDCLIAPVERNITVIEYREPVTSANFSSSEVRDALLDRPLCSELLQRLSNNFQEVVVASNNLSERVGGVELEFSVTNDELLNQTIEDNSELRGQLRLWRVIPLYVIGLLLLGGVVLWLWLKSSRARKMGGL